MGAASDVNDAGDAGTADHHYLLLPPLSPRSLYADNIGPVPVDDGTARGF